MQLLTEVDVQLACDRLLEIDECVMYSGYLNSTGCLVAEATKLSISNHDKLTIMVLPISTRNDSLVLATLIGSNITEIVGKAKKLLASRAARLPMIVTN